MESKILKRGIIVILTIIIILGIIVFKSKSQKIFETSNITIVGDSRMVGLCSYNWYKKEKGSCIAKTAIGYKWLVNVAIEEVSKLELNKKSNIVVNLGVNDLYNINNYIKKYKELVEGEWHDSRLIILSVNPTKGGYDKLNKEIDEFNYKISQLSNEYSNVSYCDTNSYLKGNGFNSRDGLHYDSETSKIIYDKIKECIINF